MERMFNCAFCKKTSKAREKPIRHVTEYRPKTYSHRVGVFWDSQLREWFDDPGGAGSEIVSEVAICAGCAKEVNLDTRA